MAGYSQTPTARKLGVTTALRLVDEPDGWLPEGMPDEAELTEDADVVVVFARTAADLREQVPRLAPDVFPARALWVAWPRKAGGHLSDVDENLVREVALPLGLVDVKVAALDPDWSGLKLVWRKELRG